MFVRVLVWARERIIVRVDFKPFRWLSINSSVQSTAHTKHMSICEVNKFNFLNLMSVYVKYKLVESSFGS